MPERGRSLRARPSGSAHRDFHVGLPDGLTLTTLGWLWALGSRSTLGGRGDWCRAYLRWVVHVAADDCKGVNDQSIDVLEIAPGFFRIAVHVELNEQGSKGRALVGCVDARPLSIATVRRGGGRQASLLASYAPAT